MGEMADYYTQQGLDEILDGGNEDQIAYEERARLINELEAFIKAERREKSQVMSELGQTCELDWKRSLNRLAALVRKWKRE
jgi:hypothetical protein